MALENSGYFPVIGPGSSIDAWLTGGRCDDKENNREPQDNHNKGNLIIAGDISINGNGGNKCPVYAKIWVEAALGTIP